MIHFLAFLVSALITTSAWAGAATSAGGTGIRLTPSSPLIFLDYFLKDLQVTPENHTIAPFEETEMMKRSHIDKIRVAQYERLEDLTKTHLEQWVSQVQNNIVRSIVHSISSQIYIGFYLVPYRFTPQPIGVDVPWEIGHKYPSATFELIGVFMKKFGLMVSLPAWNELGDESKMAFLIHERLRKFQIQHEFGFSDSAIQELTKILSGPPSLAAEAKIMSLWEERINDYSTQDLVTHFESFLDELSTPYPFDHSILHKDELSEQDWNNLHLLITRVMQTTKMTHLQVKQAFDYSRAFSRNAAFVSIVETENVKNKRAHTLFQEFVEQSKVGPSFEFLFEVKNFVNTSDYEQLTLEKAEVIRKDMEKYLISTGVLVSAVP